MMRWMESIHMNMNISLKNTSMVICPISITDMDIKMRNKGKKNLIETVLNSPVARVRAKKY
jgi:hypothetical protein